MKKLVSISIINILLLLICIIASIVYGSKSVDYLDVFKAIIGLNYGEYTYNVIVARIPRTILGIIAGASLAISGAVMQSITRNPIADPSILGINTGAALAVIIGIVFFDIQTKTQYIWIAFLGAIVTATFVYLLASINSGGITPLKLSLSGAIVTIMLSAFVSFIMLPNIHAMNRFRFWQAGGIGGANWQDILALTPYFLVGAITSILMSSSLNALVLGDETASSLGVNIGFVRIVSSLAAVLLSASTTALAGPIAFVGLVVPHFMRALLGPDLRKIIPYSIIGGACLLLIADIIGRLVGSPAELECGIVTALIGAPIFIVIIRKVKVASL